MNHSCPTAPFADLTPAPVWRHFATLCAIPRPSKHEAALRAHLAAWATERGLATEQDGAGNLLIRKAGSPGREDEAGVILQGHLDMVCQKNSGTDHDFHRDPIRPVRDGDWLVAPDTTLGADNGLGVALALAVLEAEGLSHPPLEVLLTVDEEAGMGGALGLQPGWLRGTRLINIDTEEWGHFYLGCAGGLDVNVDWTLPSNPAPAGWTAARIDLAGLRGGHSGIDIDKGRGNAIKLLVRLLRDLADAHPGAFRLTGLDGGTARNALAREASATLAANPASLADLQATLLEKAAVIGREYAGVEDRLSARLSTGAPDEAPSPVLSAAAQAALLAAFNAAPHGVARMSQSVAGVVETSNNLGVLTLAGGRARANFMVRSLVDSAALAHARAIADLFAPFVAAGPDCRVTTGDNYPGWRPNPESPLLALAQEVFAKEFPADNGGVAKVEVIHAGLECGIIGAAYPGLDMLSFGPTIRGAHAPGERVEVASVAKCWQLLTALLAALPPR
ncbi:dipeptidase D [Oryzomicrobium terrae]|uniref:Cytosol non-specific dipeptidase n=1 Tax=Oryzomicrobium terrae TaxID=1735038 RepID=A0A5C1E899_9RHOO|nr:aminoacyl-histidine dipeptidase [Oryzomicrobium terrae]QEL64855.1 dipeptidase D [Oryzomicrobium terrae]